MPETVRSFDGTRIAYVVKGSGPAVLLLHGFGADHVLNWARPGVDRRADRRGPARHRDGRPRPWRLGQAAQPRRVTAATRWCAMRRRSSTTSASNRSTWSATRWARWSQRDSFPRSRVPARSCSAGWERRSCHREAGAGRPRQSRPRSWPTIRRRSRASPGRPSASSPIFTGADRQALAALSRSDSLRYSVRFDAITVPTLVVAGADDRLIRSPSELADRLPSARSVTVAGDHLGAPSDPAFSRALVEFLEEAHQ